MLLDAANGRLTWMPTEAQGPSTNVVTVKVTDSGTPALSDTRTFTVVVHEVNNSPILDVVNNQTIQEGSLLSLKLSATDTDVPANTMTYSLASGPSGMTVDSSTGLLNWSPSEAQGPSTNAVVVKVTDSGAPALTIRGHLDVVVLEVNSSPVLAAVPPQFVDEGKALNYLLSAADPDQPANALTFRLVSGPAGMTVNSATGMLTWTPGEEHGPGTFPITVSVADAGVPSLVSTQSFQVFVAEVNRAPELNLIPDQQVSEGAKLSLNLSASDPDLPANTLSYALVSGPAGASVSPSGKLLWPTGMGGRAELRSPSQWRWRTVACRR